MQTFFQLRESLQDAKDKHNFTLDDHKKAEAYHQKMRDAHMHADEHDPGDTPHYKSAVHHSEAAIQHSYVIDHMKGEPDNTPLKKRVEYAHKLSMKANKHTSKSHAGSMHDDKFRKRFDDHLKNNGGANNPYGKKK